MRRPSVIRLGVILCALLGALTEPRAHGETTPRSNRLIGEKSPYLRAHAYNPVDWFPWGEEAFAKARRENKPIFLSVGYSTCHWCHVMARESFENPAVAALLNENFVCIKVDREERPDIDRVYMLFVQASTGAGGWPLSVWLTPELKPFLGGTYYAPESRIGQPGFKAVLGRVAEMWKTEREKVVQHSDEMMVALATDAASTAPAGGLELAQWRRRAYQQITEVYDADHGGFEPAPKFAQPSTLTFLLELSATSAEATQRTKAAAMALKTLREIVSGGIHDHLGGGFHRYSVDGRWHVPHFEKMLYDQAQISTVLLSAWQLTGEPELRDAARATLDYVRRDLTDPRGGFYSAEDADSARVTPNGEHAEGAFYVWTAAEIDAVLDEKEAAIFKYAFGVKADGNAEGEDFAARNVLHRSRSSKECAKKFSVGEDVVDASLASSREMLFAARKQRPRPGRDDKIITAWNGLMISAFARGAQVLAEPEYAAVATRAAVFLEGNLLDVKTGRLARSFRAGVRDDRGFVEDYAFVIQGLLDLYETSFDVRWLSWAVRLQEKQNELFLDKRNGGYCANTDDDPRILLRLKDELDSVEPAPSSVAARNLARLAAIFHRDEWSTLAEQTGRAFGPVFERTPAAMPLLLASLGWLEGTPKQIIIAGAAESSTTRRLVGEVWARFLPRHVLLRIDDTSRDYFSAKVPLIAELPAVDGSGAATAYVCENFVCQLPTQDPEQFVKLLTRPTTKR